MAKSDIDRLYRISEKSSRLIIGLMSGTSVDGLDIGLCEISGSGLETKARVLNFETVPYEDTFKSDVREIFAVKNGSIEKLCLLNAKIGEVHAGMILTALKKWSIKPSAIDMIASHGQTVFHAPKRLHHFNDYPNATLQIGDADQIAVKTGIITVSDFRQKHIAAGGEGAPLAHIGDYLLFGSKKENRIMLNIGGISNFTFLPAGGTIDESVSTDCGPGNTLIDALARRDFDRPFDANAEIALAGKVDFGFLEILLKHPFFKEELPKTTGPELFNLRFIENGLNEISHKIANNDLLATITFLTAKAISETIQSICLEGAVYVSGGGAKNPMIMNSLQELLPHFKVTDLSELGVSADAKEALLFAILANENAAGERLSAKLPTMGKISFPG